MSGVARGTAAVAGPVPEAVAVAPGTVTVKSTLRVVEGFGARKRSQWAPAGVSAGIVTSPLYAPVESAFHWPRISSSSSLMVTVCPAGNFVTSNGIFPPGCT